jgi:Small subunit of acetolactate synthase
MSIVADHTPTKFNVLVWSFADRELAFFKIRAPHGTIRSEILELTNIFGAKVVDVGPLGLTIALAGDPGKLFAFEQAVRPFGVAQLARTGRITLQRSDQNLDMGGGMSYSTGSSIARAARDHSTGASIARHACFCCGRQVLPELYIAVLVP